MLSSSSSSSSSSATSRLSCRSLLLAVSASILIVARVGAAVAVVAKDGEGRHRGSPSRSSSLLEGAVSNSNSNGNSVQVAGSSSSSSSSDSNSRSRKSALGSNSVKHFASPHGSKDEDIDKINRMMDLFASVPETLQNPEARDLAHHLEDLAENGGEDLKHALEEASHPPKSGRAPHLMRRAVDAVEERRQVHGSSDALLQAPSGEYPPLPDAFQTMDQTTDGATAGDAATAAVANAQVTESKSNPDAPGVTFTKVYSNSHVDVPIPDISGGFDLEALEKRAQTTLYPPWWSVIADSEDDVTVPTAQIALPEPDYWIEEGCRFGTGTPLKGNFSTAKGKVAYVQCCTSGQGPRCTRKSNDVCLQNTEAVTFYEAKQICENAGMRLCSKTELHDSPDALGCCGGGCGLDNLLVWTETMSSDSEWALNKRLTKRVNDLRSKNLDLLREHLSTELRLEALKNTATDDMFTTPAPPVEPSASNTIARVLERNTDLKKTYNVLKEENEMLRKRLTSMIHWSAQNRIVAPTWWEAQKEYWQSPAAHWNLENHTAKEMQPNFRHGPKMDLNWVHRYEPKDWGWQWSPSTTTQFYRHEGDNKFHGRMGNYDSWPPENDAGAPDSEYWPVERPVPTTPEPAKPDWLPQPISKGHLEQYEEAKHNGLFSLGNYVPLWNRFR